MSSTIEMIRTRVPLARIQLQNSHPSNNKLRIRKSRRLLLEATVPHDDEEAYSEILAPGEDVPNQKGSPKKAPESDKNAENTENEAHVQVKTLRRSSRIRKHVEWSDRLNSHQGDASNHGLQRRIPNKKKAKRLKLASGISVYDVKWKDEILYVPDYATDIFQSLYDAESKTRPLPYIDTQPDLSVLWRCTLIDWIVWNHWNFHMTPETLYLAINIVDRFLERRIISQGDVCLVGVTALRIASKYEDQRYVLTVVTCRYLTSSEFAYTSQNILDMETRIVKQLDYCLTVPTGYHFLVRFLHICDVSNKTDIWYLSNFYMDRMLQEHRALNHPPSILAAAVISLAMNNPDVLDNKAPPGLPKSLLKYTGFQVADILEAAGLIERAVGADYMTPNGRLRCSTKQKYSTDMFNNVSMYTPPEAAHLSVL